MDYPFLGNFSSAVPIMYADNAPATGSSSGPVEAFGDNHPSESFFMGDFLSNDLELASQVSSSNPLLPLQQRFATSQFGICGEQQDMHQQLWLQRQQPDLASQPIMQNSYSCASQQQHPPMSQVSSSTLLNPERSILVPPVSTLPLMGPFNAPFPQPYGLLWDFRSPPLSSPEEGLPVSEDQGYFNEPSEDGSFRLTSEDLPLEGLEESGSIGHPAYGPGTASSEQPYLHSPASTTTSLVTTGSRQLDLFTDSESEEIIVPAKTKRVRRSVKGANRNQSPQIKLKCTHPGCSVTCSSYPSLDRHQQTHKWRGIYAPVRCEACLRELSNEYSVQRHIRRSQPGSLCRRMRVYSIMRSRTEVETTVRFYPKRPHGKKTVVINLEEARARFLPTPVN